MAAAASTPARGWRLRRLRLLLLLLLLLLLRH
jgi:hypothetical protein